MNTTYVAFLRAINVAGHTLVKMADLKEAFVVAGCENVSTYIQSGNVIFQCAAEECSAGFPAIRLQLRSLLGAEPGVVFRTLREIDRIVKSAPFKGVQDEPHIKLYVSFLAERPRRKPRLPLVSVKEALETIAIKNREAFIVSRRKPNGFFGFPNNFIEKELGVPATTRNWSTVTKIMINCSVAGTG